MHYTLEELKQKTLKELKEIGYQLNVLPEGDRRCRQNWIDALIGINPPLLQLLEASPAVVETVQEAIESKFGRIIYPRPTAKPIAPADNLTPEINGTGESADRPRTADADLHNSRIPAAKSDGGNSVIQAETLRSKESAQLLATTQDIARGQRRALFHQSTELIPYPEGERPPNRGDNGRDRLENEPRMSQSAIIQAAKNSPGVKLSDRFLATYPPYFGDVHYKAEVTGQLNLLEPVTDDEPPDPDDFDSLDEFCEAMARWDAENAEALTISNDSMCEWAPCPDEWYEPEAEIVPIKASSIRESSSTCNFSIPTFDAWCDRPNRQTDSDEPPDTGIFARLPKPKPPSFPPMIVGKGDRANRIRKFARGATLAIGRAPPGGDAM